MGVDVVGELLDRSALDPVDGSAGRGGRRGRKLRALLERDSLGPGAAGLVVVAVAVVALAVEVAADVAGAVGLLLDELLPPQAATNTAAAGRSGARARRQVIATPNGT